MHKAGRILRNLNVQIRVQFRTILLERLAVIVEILVHVLIVVQRRCARYRHVHANARRTGRAGRIAAVRLLRDGVASVAAVVVARRIVVVGARWVVRIAAAHHIHAGRQRMDKVHGRWARRGRQQQARGRILVGQIR